MLNKKQRLVLFLVLIIVSVYTFASSALAASVGAIVNFQKSSYTDVSASKNWSRNGFTTLISNNPEVSYGEGFLYSDSTINTTGRFRVFWAHEYRITGSSGGYIGFFLFNNTGKQIKVNLGKYGKAVNASNVIAGQSAADSYFCKNATETTYATIPNGGSTYLSFYTPTGYTCVGQYDIVIRDLSNAYVTGGITVKTFMSYTHPDTFLSRNRSLLQKSGTEARGRVGYSEKQLTWQNAQKETYITFCSTVHNSWLVPVNDLDYYSSTVDSVSNAPYYGGYGIVLNITVTFAEDNYVLSISPCVLGADQSGSLNGGSNIHPMVVSVNGSTLTNDVQNGQMWIIASGNAGTTVTVQTTLIAFEYAPMRLVVTNG